MEVNYSRAMVTTLNIKVIGERATVNATWIDHRSGRWEYRCLVSKRGAQT